jgi:hypothetical protein
LEQRLAAYPRLRERRERLLDLVENSADDVILADEAERRVIEEMRQMGQEVLQDRSERGVARAEGKARSKNAAVKGNGKKLRWRTTFGAITVVEPVLLRAGTAVRPFCERARVTPRGCSRAPTNSGSNTGRKTKARPTKASPGPPNRHLRPSLSIAPPYTAEAYEHSQRWIEERGLFEQAQGVARELEYEAIVQQ